MVDILLTEPDGVRLVEVKSSTCMSDIYLHDMAFQTWVLRRCGFNVKSAVLMHLNNQYVRGASSTCGSSSLLRTAPSWFLQCSPRWVLPSSGSEGHGGATRRSRR